MGFKVLNAWLGTQPKLEFMTYARSRLWLGISGVGLLVLVASASLWLGLPRRFLSGLSGPAAIAITLLSFIALSVPSDALGGYYLPRLHGRTKISRAGFLAAWFRGVVSQAMVLGVCAATILESARWGGNRAGIACFASWMVILLLGQSLIARFVGGLKMSSVVSSADELENHIKLPKTPSPISVQSIVSQSSDPGFVGGLVGLPGCERLILPAAWWNDLTVDVLATELTRRQGVLATGSRTRGLLVALIWNLVGFIVSSNMPGSSIADAAGLIQCSLWFTLWSFLGLLTLPSINRLGVLGADRFALDQGISAAAISAAISRLDSLQDDEPIRTRWIERIFHPIPSVERRIAALGDADSPRGAWQCARTTLYLSWACFGFLSRAVHCNAGRPELWVLFPGD